jgi:hypothetical protein
MFCLKQLATSARSKIYFQPRFGMLSVWKYMFVYYLHGKPIRFEIVLMVSKLFQKENPIRIMRFPFRVTDRKVLTGCLPFTWKTH